MSCSVFLAVQSCRLTIRSLIPKFATSWFATNKVLVTLQLDMPKLLVALVFVLLPQDRALLT
jgi:hypothetical protein